MKIDDDHLYHGSALLQITEHPTFTAINSEPRTYAYNYRDSVAAGVASSTSLSSVSG